MPRPVMEWAVLTFSLTTLPLLISQISLFLIGGLHVRFERFLLPVRLCFFIGEKVRIVFNLRLFFY